MKKKILLLMGVLSLGLLQAQVGVNTLHPRGVFHIDGKGDTNNAGANFTDDILVDANGNMGIGTLSPQAKLHIDNSDGSNPFIRIQDPSEEVSDGKYLMSDADGAGSWVPKATLSGKVYRMNHPTQIVFSYPAGVDTPVLFNKLKKDDGSLDINSDGYIHIDADGNYIFTLRWFGSVDVDLVDPIDLKGFDYQELVAEVMLRKVVGGVIQSQDYGHTLVAGYTSLIYGVVGRSTFAVSMFVPNVKKGESYAIILRPSQRIGKDWEVAKGLGPVQIQNIIYFPSLTLYNI